MICNELNAILIFVYTNFNFKLTLVTSINNMLSNNMPYVVISERLYIVRIVKNMLANQILAEENKTKILFDSSISYNSNA